MKRSHLKGICEKIFLLNLKPHFTSPTCLGFQNGALGEMAKNTKIKVCSLLTNLLNVRPFFYGIT
jgi:hypothetical protein